MRTMFSLLILRLFEFQNDASRLITPKWATIRTLAVPVGIALPTARALVTDPYFATRTVGEVVRRPGHLSGLLPMSTPDIVLAVGRQPSVAVKPNTIWMFAGPVMCIRRDLFARPIEALGARLERVAMPGDPRGPFFVVFGHSVIDRLDRPPFVTSRYPFLLDVGADIESLLKLTVLKSQIHAYPVITHGYHL
jgi:hypothetical protein